MAITISVIRAALQKYDNETGPVSYYGSSLWGERDGVSELRQFLTTLPLEDRELLRQETISLAEILIKVKSINKPRHDALFKGLKEQFSLEKLQAFKRLNDNNLVDLYFDKVFHHVNPVSAARAITHFRKMSKKDIDVNLKEQTLPELLLQEDPYKTIKSKTSIARALSYLEKCNLNTPDNNKKIQEQPIPIQKALRKCINNNILIDQKILSLIEKSKEPIDMASALIELFQYKNNEHRITILEEAKTCIDPKFIRGALILLSNKKNPCDKDTLQLLKQAEDPCVAAKLIVLEEMKSEINNLNKITYSALRGVLFIQGKAIRAPETLIQEAEDKLKESFKHH
ncbi:hypothetical protein ACNVED_17045 (plasmid) [Legionella sp. D16C41]|uniref:Uncharacterized protein n=1 Tax=Legionella beliardensis TaxID=91822 RepID=A0A378JNZ1_9GAMM|nr:hypothetical protein [Legionella beliardensis]STX55492.1 Uncharacterised protein [Legionella beliardensis]